VTCSSKSSSESGSGEGPVSYSLDPNPDYERTGTITVEKNDLSASFTIEQDGEDPLGPEFPDQIVVDVKEGWEDDYGNRLEEILKEILDVSWSPNREPYPGSSPGEAPARRTGNLRDSIKVTSYQIGEEFEFSVRAADYAGFLEEGTRKMSPRQFMMKGLHQLFIEEGPIEVARYEIKPINRRAIRII